MRILISELWNLCGLERGSFLLPSEMTSLKSTAVANVSTVTTFFVCFTNGQELYLTFFSLFLECGHCNGAGFSPQHPHELAF